MNGKNETHAENIKNTTTQNELNFQQMLQTLPLTAKFAEDDWYVWGGSMVRTDDGVCHLLYARWPIKCGFSAWLTHSEIAHATAENPLGPYKFQNVALPDRGGEYWDGHTTHNPTAIQVGEKFYLYYMGNHGDKKVTKEDLNWVHRNNQRIGVAVADHPAGPWKRFDKPVLDVTPGSWDDLVVSNPSATQGADGKFLMVYKGVTKGSEADLPFGKKVLHGVAVADSPLGPFKKYPQPIFTYGDTKFPAEDPFVWYAENQYHAIVKDCSGHFTNAGQSLALWQSKDGINWQLASHPLVTKTQVLWENNKLQKLVSLERPQLWLDNEKPAVLFCAACDSLKNSYNLHIPLNNDYKIKET